MSFLLTRLMFLFRYSGVKEAAERLHDFDDAHHRLVVLMRAPLLEVARECEEFVRQAILASSSSGGNSQL